MLNALPNNRNGRAVMITIRKYSFILFDLLHVGFSADYLKAITDPSMADKVCRRMAMEQCNEAENSRMQDALAFCLKVST